MAERAMARWSLVAVLVAGLAACEEGAGPFAAETPSNPAVGATRLVERDIEDPSLFSVSEPGLWDGRPSLGGVWVAYPGVDSPERVIIRNSANGQSVVGALFRRERDNPGPQLQVSSEAATALGMLAGQPTPVSVVALRREEVALAVPAVVTPAAAPATAPDTSGAAAPTAAAPDPAPRRGPFAALFGSRQTAAGASAPPEDGVLPQAEAIAAIPLDPPGAAETTAPDAGPAAGAAPARVPFWQRGRAARETEAAAALAATAPAAAAVLPTEAAPIAPRPSTAPDQPFLQVGIFSVEANADRAAGQMRAAGLEAAIRRQTSQGNTFWRVVVGPATSAAERAGLLEKVKALGYQDAYPVRN